MLRGLLMPIIGLLLVAGTPSAAAHARVHAPGDDGVITRPEYIAGRLAYDPVFISDQVPREIGPGDAARIRAAVARMPVPTFLTVAPHVDGDPDRSEERLIALLHDRLGRDGVYVVTGEPGRAGSRPRSLTPRSRRTRGTWPRSPGRPAERR